MVAVPGDLALSAGLEGALLRPPAAGPADGGELLPGVRHRQAQAGPQPLHHQQVVKSHLYMSKSSASTKAFKKSLIIGTNVSSPAEKDVIIDCAEQIPLTEFLAFLALRFAMYRQL